MVVVTIPEGPYAGLPAQQFTTQVELEAAVNQGLIIEGSLVAVNQSVFPWVTRNGASYALGMTETAGFIGVSTSYAPHPTQLEPGSETLPVYLAFLPALTAAQWLSVLYVCAAIVVSIIVLYGVYSIVAKWKQGPVSSIQELPCGQPECPVVVTYPNGSGMVIWPGTGEILDEFEAPLDLFWIIVAIGGVAALIVLGPLIVKWLSGRPSRAEARAEAEYRPYRPPARDVREYDIDVVD